MRPPILAKLVEAAILLDLALILCVTIQRRLRLEIGTWELSVATLQLPLAVLVALALAWGALHRTALRRAPGLRILAAAGRRRPPLLALVVAPVSLGLLAANAHTWARFESDVIRRLERASRPSLRGMVVNVHNRHAVPLVRQLVTRPDPGPVVVYFASGDRRGHMAAYYLHPILLRMEPAMRRWGLRERMLETPRRDPAFHFDARDPPAIERSIEFAREAAQDLLVVDGSRVTLVFDAGRQVPE